MKNKKASNVTTYYIGVITAINAVNGGLATPAANMTQTRYAAVTRLAVSDILNRITQLNPPLPPNVKIAILEASSFGVSEGIVDAILGFYNNNISKPIALTGSTVPVETMTGSIISGVYKLPLFGPTSAVSQLSSKLDYPYFTRGRNSDIAAVIPILTLAKYMNWNKLCLVAADQFYGQGILGNITIESVQRGILLYTSMYSGLFTPDVVINSARLSFRNLIQNYDCRIFILHSPITFASYAIQAAGLEGIL